MIEKKPLASLTAEEYLKKNSFDWYNRKERTEQLVRGAGKSTDCVHLSDALEAVRLAREENELNLKDRTWRLKSVLEDIVKRIKQNHDTFWDDGTYGVNTGKKSMSAYIVPESMVEQFELDIDIWEKYSSNKLEKARAEGFEAGKKEMESNHSCVNSISCIEKYSEERVRGFDDGARETAKKIFKELDMISLKVIFPEEITDQTRTIHEQYHKIKSRFLSGGSGEETVCVLLHSQDASRSSPPLPDKQARANKEEK